jgi:hypothetical protein
VDHLETFIKQRDSLLADEANERWGRVPETLVPEHTLVIAVVRHKYNGTLVHPGQVYWMADERVERNVEAGIVVAAGIGVADYWTTAGRILGAEDTKGVVPYTSKPIAGSLQILSGVGYDPGSAAFRMHTAINEHTKHSMVFVRWDDTNPHCSIRQYDGMKDIRLVRDAVVRADVLHCHVGYLLINNVGIAPASNQLVIKHYHGSKRNGTNMEPLFDAAKGARLLGARLMLVEEARGFGMECDWSPIPMPVDRYRALRDDARHEAKWKPLTGKPTRARPLVISHSPTNSSLKGTDALRTAVSELQAKGVPVRLELISNVTLRESLRRKALSDVFFDSFWLGIQGSGLEAGAMGIPVIAGDQDAARLYKDEVGHVPYAFANNALQLQEMVERMAMDPKFRAESAATTTAYVEAHHDYAKVAKRYEASLSRWLGRTDILTEAR